MGRLSRLLGKLYRSYGFCWDLKSISQAEAMASIAQTRDVDEFWHSGKQIAAHLARYMARDSTVLDFGSGIGRVAKFVAPHCRELWCVDVSSRMLSIASSALRGLENVHFVRTKGRRIPLGDEKFDFAYSILTFQHMEKEDVYAALREIWRVLKIGALAYFSFPNFLSDDYFNGFLKNVENPDMSPIRLRLYSPKEVEKILASLGFKVLSFWNPNSILKEPTEITPLVEKERFQTNRS